MRISEYVKGVAILLLFLFSIVYVAIDFGTRLRTSILAKRELDSLKMQNLLLDIEIKKRKLE